MKCGFSSFAAHIAPPVPCAGGEINFRDYGNPGNGDGKVFSFSTFRNGTEKIDEDNYKMMK